MSIKTNVISLYCLTFLLTYLAFGYSIAASAQALPEKLKQRVEQLPKPNQPIEQLIEVARQYQIPMGIEWVETLDKKIPPDLPLSSLGNTSTVQDVIKLIVGRISGYKVTFGESLVFIYQAQVLTSSKNFLNLRIPSIRFSESNLRNAEGSLRQQIRITLNPGKYAKGWNGGYGYPSEEGNERKVSLNFQNAKVRDILNGLVAAQGNSAWVVRLITTKEMLGGKYFEQGPLNSGQRVTDDFYWQVINFSVK